MTGDVGRAVEETVRRSYGRLVAYLARSSRDLAAAEDALSDALAAALESWPRTGVPRAPEAWLLTAARRKLVDRARRTRVAEVGGATLAILADEAVALVDREDRLPDHRLDLMFACTHPAIDPAIHTPLILQTVLGFDAAMIAAAFLVQPTTMGQRLARAKAKIRDAGIPFSVPPPAERAARLEAVLAAVYAAHTLEADAEPGDGTGFSGMAIDLARLLAALMPTEAEALGLLALLLHVEARRPARGLDGRYVPLADQDPALWDPAMLNEAEALLGRASRLRRLGRFQLEAAIQSVHAGRAVSGRTEWPAVVQLYEGLLAIAPSVGAMIGHAVAIAETDGAAAGLARLAEIPAARVAAHQPYFAATAELLARLGRRQEAIAAYERAIGLARSDAVRRHLAERRERV